MNVVTFPAPTRATPATPPTPFVPAPVIDLLAAVEAMPWNMPRVVAVRGLDRVVRVHAVVPQVAAVMTPEQARGAADVVDAEQAFAGCGAVSAALRAAADAADAGAAFVPDRRPARGDRLFVAAAGALAAVIGVWATVTEMTFGGGLFR